MVARARAVAVLAAALAGACGSPPPAAPAPVAATAPVRALTPQAYPAAAKAATEAFILGADERGGAAVVPLAGRPSSITVDVVVSRAGVAAVAAVELTSTPAVSGLMRLGLFDDGATDLGPSWPAGVWMAAVIATGVLGKDVTDYTLSAAAGADVDGAASSAMLAGGFLASMLGVAVDPGAMVTGTLLPDGSIGPAARLPDKLAAAAAAGKRRLGTPAGLREVVDGGEPVDPAAHARGAGATAVEVADLEAALALLTGAELPRPLPLPEAELALPPAALAALDEQVGAWNRRLAGLWPRLLALSGGGRLPAPLASLAGAAERATARASRLRGHGAPAAAHHQLVRAWIDAAAVTWTADVLARVGAGDLAGARARLDEQAALAGEVDAALRALGAQAAAGGTDAATVVAALEHAIAGWGLHARVDDQLTAARGALVALDGTPASVLASRATADRLAATVTPAMLDLARMAAAGVVAADLAALAGAPAATPVPPVALRRLGSSYRDAGRAVVAHVEALAVTDADLDVARLAATVDDDPALRARLELTGPGDASWLWFRLAAGEVALYRAWGALARRHALGATVDAVTGRATAVGHPLALTSLLATADLRARQQAHAARVATGAVPIAALLRHQIARSLATGELDDQLAALEHYWAATRAARMAAMLARNR